MPIRSRSAFLPTRPKANRRISRGFLQLERLESRELLTTYGVGPGQAYSSIGAVPWTSLNPGDTVAIHWQSTPYHEKILVSESGTASQPINIIGVPGPNGQQPVIDGANATTSGQFHYYYTPLEENSLVLIQRSADQNYNYKPSFINISGLEFKDAYQTNKFTDASGATQTYAQFAAAIYIEGANNITIQNSTLDNSGLGLFVLSNGDESHTTRNVMVEGNYIYGNGVPGQYLEHNVYSEAVGITYQYNDFGPLRDGSAGNDLKDRSAGTVIRYNYFSPGGHILDLVDPEDSSIVATDPNFTNTYVYGNVLDNTGPNGATFLVHFGGDSGDSSIYRPHLEFYDNTVVNTADQVGSNGRWRTIMFNLDTNSQSVNAYNNIFYNGPATAGSAATQFELMNTDGVANFGANWVSPGWLPSYDTQPFSGTITGTNNFFTDPNNNPGFVNLSGGNYQLSAGSSAINRGVAITSNDPAVAEQYAAPASETTRPNVNDLGAFASPTSTKVMPTVVSTSPAAGATSVPVSTSLVATFNEPIASGLSFVLSSSSGAVAATFSSSSATATLVPSAPLMASTTYTATISGATDSGGNAMAAPYSWSFTTAAPASSGVSLWDASVTPAVASASDGSAVELGVKFTSDTAGSITGLRFYKGTANTGTHVGHLWNGSGKLLATATFSGETASGWQQMSFATPVSIAANTTYVASYFAPKGGYAFNPNYFAAAYNRTPLHTPANAGVFVYGSKGGFPSGTYNGGNYWVDVVFNPGTKPTWAATGAITARASAADQKTSSGPVFPSSYNVPLTPSISPPDSSVNAATNEPDDGLPTNSSIIIDTGDGTPGAPKRRKPLAF